MSSTVNSVDTRSWRYFTMLEMREAFEWADGGGVAVHDSGRSFRGERAAHLFAADEATLVAAAARVGVEARRIQRDSIRLHFDLFGLARRRALRLCGVDPADAGRTSPRA